MKEQQYVAVWLYVEWLSSYKRDGSFWISARNKGVGPALIKKVEIRLDGKVVNGPAELRAMLLGPDSKVGFITSTLEGRVLSPGEEVEPLRIPDTTQAAEFSRKYYSSDFQMDITYASVYGECWKSIGIKVSKVACPE